MKFHNLQSKAACLGIIWVLLMGPVLATAQTEIKPSKNKYKVEEDIKLGLETAAEVEKTFPVLQDRDGNEYLERVGERLVTSIPRKFQQPAFDYNFKIINASDINAFALPGGPMYVNRGMIEAAKNEGEMAGVMAHEISHVALRHGTAQATKMNSAWNQLIGIGAIIGGAIIGGDTGAAIGAILYAGFFLFPYSREQEKQADILGAQILANANYDPNDLANMFRTIEKESGGGGGPDWFSTHPAPSKRYETISREARMLEISPDPIKRTPDFERTQRRLKALPKTKTLAEFEEAADKKAPSGGGGGHSGNGGYRTRVEVPSSEMKDVRNGNWLFASVPENWRDYSDGDSIELAPEGAHGEEGITHGMLIGIYRSGRSDLGSASREHLDEILKANTYLRANSGFERATIGGQPAYMVTLEGISPVTGKVELVTVYTTELRDKDICYIMTVVPESERSSYRWTFRSVLNSIRLYY